MKKLDNLSLHNKIYKTNPLQLFPKAGALVTNEIGEGVIEAQILSEFLINEEGTLEITADNEQCEALLATDAAQSLLEKMPG